MISDTAVTVAACVGVSAALVGLAGVFAFADAMHDGSTVQNRPAQQSAAPATVTVAQGKCGGADIKIDGSANCAPKPGLIIYRAPPYAFEERYV